MKTYVDFISDLTLDRNLLHALEQDIPFDSRDTLAQWFFARGYSLSEHDAKTLFDNQTSLMNDVEQVNY